LSYRKAEAIGTGSWPELNILADVDRGCILSNPLPKAACFHEFAHILDYHGIRGIYEDRESRWTYLERTQGII
jgi:hypothetical protein